MVWSYVCVFRGQPHRVLGFRRTPGALPVLLTLTSTSSLVVRWMGQDTRTGSRSEGPFPGQEGTDCHRTRPTLDLETLSSTVDHSATVKRGRIRKTQPKKIKLFVKNFSIYIDRIFTTLSGQNQKREVKENIFL